MNVLTPREEFLVQKSVETVLRMLPAVLARLMEQGAYSQKLLDDFHAKYAHLKGDKSFALVVQQVENQHPDWETSQILSTAAEQYTQTVQQAAVNYNADKPALDSLDGRARSNGIL
jgi:hypothetical protein